MELTRLENVVLSGDHSRTLDKSEASTKATRIDVFLTMALECFGDTSAQANARPIGPPPTITTS